MLLPTTNKVQIKLYKQDKMEMQEMSQMQQIFDSKKL